MVSRGQASYQFSYSSALGKPASRGIRENKSRGFHRRRRADGAYRPDPAEAIRFPRLSLSECMPVFFPRVCLIFSKAVSAICKRESRGDREFAMRTRLTYISRAVREGATFGRKIFTAVVRRELCELRWLFL